MVLGNCGLGNKSFLFREFGGFSTISAAATESADINLGSERRLTNTIEHCNHGSVQIYTHTHIRTYCTASVWVHSDMPPQATQSDNMLQPPIHWHTTMYLGIHLGYGVSFGPCPLIGVDAGLARGATKSRQNNTGASIRNSIKPVRPLLPPSLPVFINACR